MANYSTWPELFQVFKLESQRTDALGQVQQEVRYGLTSWLWQVITGVGLVILLGLHIIANHFIAKGGLRDFADVVAYLRSPIFLVLEVFREVQARPHDRVNNLDAIEHCLEDRKLMAGALFVVVLIQAFEWATINQKWLEARFGRGTSREGIDSKIQGGHQLRVNGSLLFSFSIDDLDHIAIQARDYAHLIHSHGGLLRLDFNAQARRSDHPSFQGTFGISRAYGQAIKPTDIEVLNIL